MSVTEIRTAIKEALLGEIGPLAATLTDLFRYGTFLGQPRQAAEARLIQGYHWFDVKVSRNRDDTLGWVPNQATERLLSYDVSIHIYTSLPTAPAMASRLASMASHIEACDLAVKALGTPQTLLETAGGDATGIVDGVMQSPAGTGFPSRVTTETPSRLETILSGLIRVQRVDLYAWAILQDSSGDMIVLDSNDEVIVLQ